MNGETREVLITVKAYPNPSRKYQETVCVAGIDIERNRWIRLYPIPFRDLDQNKKFRKYNIIKVNVSKAGDKRPESFRVNPNSIQILDKLGTKNHWEKRKAIVLNTVSKSMCEILRMKDTEDKSLGIFKPCKVKFLIEDAPPKDKLSRESCYAQLSLFNDKKDEIEYIPYKFRYHFFCKDEPDCPGHNYSIVDWEIGQAYRKWRWDYRDKNLLLGKIQETWLDQMCSEKRDTYFYVGNMRRFRNNFLVLGVFYPPKI